MESADFRTNSQAHSPKSQGSQTTYKVRVGGTTLPCDVKLPDTVAAPNFTSSDGMTAPSSGQMVGTVGARDLLQGEQSMRRTRIKRIGPLAQRHVTMSG